MSDMVKAMLIILVAAVISMFLIKIYSIGYLDGLELGSSEAALAELEEEHGPIFADCVAYDNLVAEFSGIPIEEPQVKIVFVPIVPVLKEYDIGKVLAYKIEEDLNILFAEDASIRIQGELDPHCLDKQAKVIVYKDSSTEVIIGGQTYQGQKMTSPEILNMLQKKGEG